MHQTVLVFLVLLFPDVCGHQELRPTPLSPESFGAWSLERRRPPDLSVVLECSRFRLCLRGPRLRGGRAADSGQQRQKRLYDDFNDGGDDDYCSYDEDDLPTFGYTNPDLPQVPFARKEGKLLEFEFPEGYRDEDDAAKLAQDRAERAERRRKIREQEQASEEIGAEAPACDASEVAHDEESLKKKFLNTLTPEEREVCEEFFAYQLKNDPDWDWRSMTLEAMEAFHNATSEETRTDSFPLLDREKAEELERHFEQVTSGIEELPDLISSAPMSRLVTWYHSQIAQYGVMWDVTARGHAVTVRGIHAGSLSNEGPVPYTLWTTEGHWRYKCHSGSMWRQIGGGTVALPFETGFYAPVPLSAEEGVTVRAGCTQAFYLHTAADEDGVALRTWPCEAVDDGPACAPNSSQYYPDSDTWALDGTRYRFDEAPAGGVVDRNTDLLVLRGAVSPEPEPFVGVAEHEVPVAWCGMIDYEVQGRAPPSTGGRTGPSKP